MMKWKIPLKIKLAVSSIPVKLNQQAQNIYSIPIYIYLHAKINYSNPVKVFKPVTACRSKPFSSASLSTAQNHF